MALFGIGDHEEKHDVIERQLRRLIEQVAQLSIDLGVTRTELRRLRLQVEGKVTSEEIDSSLFKLNDGVKLARAKLAEAEAAAEETWGTLREDLSKAIDELRDAYNDGAEGSA